MNGPPPDWDNVPPPDEGGYGQSRGAGNQRGGNGQRNGGGGRSNRPKMTSEQIQHAAAGFFAWLAEKDTLLQLKMMLPDYVDPDVFIATCKTAVLNKPDLLEERYRPSLMVAVMKAGGQGLKPDGKEGALIPRWSDEAGGYAVSWQPMVHGIMKLGRETGAIRNIRAVIVYHREPFEIIQGEEDIINHRVDIDIEEEAFTALHAGLDEFKSPKADPDAFFEHVRAAYCFITGTDGTVTKRWMTRKRLQTLKDSARAKNGPWNSVFIDEMIRKAVILFTSKWINLDTESAPAKRFHAALLTDLEVDFNRQDQIGHAVPERQHQQPALEAPGTKLDIFEQLHSRKPEPVPVGAEGEADMRVSQAAPSPAGAEVEEVGRPGPASSAPLSSDAPVDPILAEQVDRAIGDISRMSQEEAFEEVGKDRYKSLIRRLNNAGQHALMKRLSDAVTAAQRGTPS